MKQIKHEVESKKPKTVEEVVESMTEDQKNVMYFMIGQALEEKQNGKSENE